MLSAYPVLVFVSIHAPARGATIIVPTLLLCGICFNPRPCARGDFI